MPAHRSDLTYEDFFEHVAKGMEKRGVTVVKATEQMLSVLSGFSTWSVRRMRAEAELRGEPFPDFITIEEAKKRAEKRKKERKKCWGNLGLFP